MRVSRSLGRAGPCVDGRRATIRLVETTPTGQAGLRNLLEASRALTSELSLDALLERIVQVAAELTGSQYAALGVIDRTGTQLERFITHGIDADLHAAIGDLPRGRGVLG